MTTNAALPVVSETDTAPGGSATADRVRPEVLAEFRKHTASVLTGVFAASAFDQVALVPVAAAVDRSGRFAANFADRGVRSGASGILALWGDPVDRKAEAEWLKERHRDVHGHGKGAYRDVRYSALNPKTWVWIGVSGMFVPLNTFTYCTGIELRPAEQEAAYQMMRETFAELELTSKSGKLPADLAAARRYYDDMVEHELATNPFLVQEFAKLTRLPLPTLGISPVVRAVLLPLWLLIRPLVGHVIQVCSAQAMHPGVRRLVGFDLKRRHDIEFAVYVRVLQTAWRFLPDRLLLAPLAYNRLQYEKLVRAHRKYALDTFAVPSNESGCPI
ncbi:oxygenase MpaB family protein [Nocardia farcinica]|uniref:oxygenase MpaB family protein n=1 Tax=Nocardia farcinica TaxID=37329 RepID=UPI001E5B0E9E|nr:oxygenase MpaB family protein [Nocardia farcinica]MCZ9325741.1 oxygenase MpaB family protein [Nocardia farcinica]